MLSEVVDVANKREIVEKVTSKLLLRKPGTTILTEASQARASHLAEKGSR